MLTHNAGHIVIFVDLVKFVILVIRVMLGLVEPGDLVQEEEVPEVICEVALKFDPTSPSDAKRPLEGIDQNAAHSRGADDDIVDEPLDDHARDDTKDVRAKADQDGGSRGEPPFADASTEPL